MPGDRAVKTVVTMIVMSVAITLVLIPLTGTAGTFPSESIQSEGGFLLENDHTTGDNNAVYQTNNETSTRQNLSMARFELNNVVVDDEDNVPGIRANRLTKSFETPDGDRFMMEITADTMEIDGPDDGVPDMRLWSSEFHGENIVASAGISLSLNCWTDEPSQESLLTLVQGVLSVDMSNAQFKAHKMVGQDVTIEGFELDMRNKSTRYSVSTHTNDTDPYGCQASL